LREATRLEATRETEETEETGAAPVGRFPRLSRGWRSVSQVFARLVGSPVRVSASQQASGIYSADKLSLTEPIERELLDCELRLAIRNVEREVLKGLVEILSYERESNQKLLNLLYQCQQAAMPAAAQAEKIRDYGLSGGEMLLNSEALTEATIKNSLIGSDSTQVRWHDYFRTLCLDLLSQVDGKHDTSLVQQMYEAIYTQVSQRLEAQTIVDVIMALKRHNPHFAARLHSTFEAIARADFLAPGYERRLDLQRFASVTYVSSDTPGVNAAFRMMLDELLETVHVAARITAVEKERETLRFCIVDYVPLTALAFYHHSRFAYENHKVDPRYRVHPELVA
jgi:hypothetical protein